MATAFPLYGKDTLIKVWSQNYDGTAGEYYSAVIGANSRVAFTTEGWLEVSSGWVYVQIPHDNGGSPLWSPARWPWASGNGVRAGVSGYSVDDHVILTIDAGGIQSVVFGAITSGANSSRGKYQTNAAILDIDPRTQYLQTSAGQTVVAVIQMMPAALSDQIANCKLSAQELLS